MEIIAMLFAWAITGGADEAARASFTPNVARVYRIKFCDLRLDADWTHTELDCAVGLPAITGSPAIKRIFCFYSDYISRISVLKPSTAVRAMDTGHKIAANIAFSSIYRILDTQKTMS